MRRLKISAPYREFIQEINSLIRIDNNNQSSFSSTISQSKQIISKHQLVLLTEGLFFSAYRAFESLVEEVFLLYTLEKPNIKNKKTVSYLKPRNFEHAFDLIKSSLRYLDWQSPDIVINRAETYLKNGGQIKTPLTSNRVILNQMKKIRNRIAHTSRESLNEYKKVLLSHYKIIPLKIPKPGDFLLNIVPGSNPPIHYLVYFLENLKNIATDMTH